jgi:small subunit ribosomal protein S6
MNNYQLLFIIDNGIGEEDKVALIDKFSGVVESLGGTVNSVEKWGAKKLSYPIQNKKDGYYVLMKFAADSSAPAEIDRQMKINDNIIRQMITRI